MEAAAYQYAGAAEWMFILDEVKSGNLTHELSAIRPINVKDK
jgi:hypothetical protein